VRLVPVLRVTNAFHARVVAARLGSEGIVTSFRGSVEGPYPMGAVEVLVDRDDLEVAKEILLADEVESAFEGELAGEEGDGYEPGAPATRPSLGRWLLTVAALLLALVAVALALLLA